MTQFTSDDCVLDRCWPLLDTLHNSLLHVNLWLWHWILFDSLRLTLVHWPCFVTSLLIVSLDLVQNTLEGVEGTKPSLPRLHLVWWLDVLDLFLCTSLHQPLCMPPLDSISWDCTSWIVSCVALPLKGCPTWHWRVKTLFTMRHSHVVIHHDDGMDQVVLYQLVLYIDFALCRLYCLYETLLDYWLVSLHALAINSCRGCTLSGGASDQIKGNNPFSNSWFLILWPLHDASWYLLTVAIADLSSLTLTLWRLYPLRGSLEWDLRVIRPFTMSSLILFDSHGLIWSLLLWSLIVFGWARPPDALDLALPLTSWSCMLTFYTWPLPRSCLSKLTCWLLSDFELIGIFGFC